MWFHKYGMKYTLVNCHTTMEHQHLQWVNQRLMNDNFQNWFTRGYGVFISEHFLEYLSAYLWESLWNIPVDD